jgi:hypothetical protein
MAQGSTVQAFEAIDSDYILAEHCKLFEHCKRCDIDPLVL